MDGRGEVPRATKRGQPCKRFEADQTVNYVRLDALQHRIFMVRPDAITSWRMDPLAGIIYAYEILYVHSKSVGC